jgi:hypothetical protein
MGLGSLYGMIEMGSLHQIQYCELEEFIQNELIEWRKGAAKFRFKMKGILLNEKCLVSPPGIHSLYCP